MKRSLGSLCFSFPFTQISPCSLPPPSRVGSAPPPPPGRQPAPALVPGGSAASLEATAIFHCWQVGANPKKLVV